MPGFIEKLKEAIDLLGDYILENARTNPGWCLSAIFVTFVSLFITLIIVCRPSEKRRDGKTEKIVAPSFKGGAAALGNAASGVVNTGETRDIHNTQTTQVNKGSGRNIAITGGNYKQGNRIQIEGNVITGQGSMIGSQIAGNLHQTFGGKVNNSISIKRHLPEANVGKTDDSSSFEAGGITVGHDASGVFNAGKTRDIINSQTTQSNSGEHGRNICIEGGTYNEGHMMHVSKQLSDLQSAIDAQVSTQCDAATTTAVEYKATCEDVVKDRLADGETKDSSSFKGGDVTVGDATSGVINTGKTRDIINTNILQSNSGDNGRNINIRGGNYKEGQQIKISGTISGRGNIIGAHVMGSVHQEFGSRIPTVHRNVRTKSFGSKPKSTSSKTLKDSSHFEGGNMEVGNEASGAFNTGKTRDITNASVQQFNRGQFGRNILVGPGGTYLEGTKSALTISNAELKGVAVGGSNNKVIYRDKKDSSIEQ